ncbi:hypothetical protein BgiBS90_002890, partial [Biomphalaria glabrata]
MALGSPYFICVSSILTLLHLTSSEIFTSTVKVERMILEEEELLKELKRYIDYQYDRLKLFY